MPSRMAFFRAFFSVDPAHAGMILELAFYPNGRGGGPRACGDDPPFTGWKAPMKKWTPRMRG